MTVGPGHERWQHSVASYALGALPGDEVAGFEAHVTACPACRDELAELRTAADALPMATPPVIARAHLKGRIMADVRAEAALLAAAGDRADRPAAAAAPTTPAERRRRPSRWGGRRWSLAPAFALAACVALLVAGGVLGALVRGGGGAGADGAARTVTARVDAKQAPGATVRLVEHEGGAATLEARDFPAAPAGRVYQVWLKKPGADPTPTAVLWSPRTDGTADVAVPGPLDGLEAVLVTAEPAGGSPAPTRAPVIAVTPA
jgi:hypothetical protein